MPCCICEADPERFCDEGQSEAFCSRRCESAHTQAYNLIGKVPIPYAIDRLALAILTNDPRLRMPEGA